MKTWNDIKTNLQANLFLICALPVLTGSFRKDPAFFHLNKIWKTSNPILHFIINDPKQVLIIDNSAVDETIFFYSKCRVNETMRCSLFQTKLKRHLPTRSCELYGFGLSCELYGVGLCFSQICLRMFLVLGLI